jgi:hypothetical protein
VTPVILIREADAQEGEIEEAERAGFFVTSTRMHIRPGNLVVGRYSVLPFYEEQYRDVLLAGATMINSNQQHRYVADLKNWYFDLEGLTPKTWFRPEEVPEEEPGAFVLKGETNSRKHDWKTHMYAANRKAVGDVAWRLNMDGIISHQQVYVRQFVPLVQYGEGLNGLPITKEFRFFVCDGKVLTGGYYWSSFDDVVPTPPSVEEVPMEFLGAVIERIKKNVRFVVIDVAQTAAGDWIVIELNDGQMSGLSGNSPAALYRGLASVLPIS